MNIIETYKFLDEQDFTIWCEPVFADVIQWRGHFYYEDGHFQEEWSDNRSYYTRRSAAKAVMIEAVRLLEKIKPNVVKACQFDWQ